MQVDEGFRKNMPEALKKGCGQATGALFSQQVFKGGNDSSMEPLVLRSDCLRFVTFVWRLASFCHPPLWNLASEVRRHNSFPATECTPVA